MKFFAGRRGFTNYGIAVLAGLMLAAAMPRLSVSFLAWIAPGLLLVSAVGAAPRRAFCLGYAGGLVHELATLHWLLNIPFPAGAVAGWLALSAYLALFFGLWVLITARKCPLVFVGEPALVSPVVSTARRVFWPLYAAAAWVAMEMAMGRFLTGFPWNALGISQYKTLPLIQICAFTGVHGVSFVVVWLSAAGVCAVSALIRRPTDSRFWVADLFLPVLAISLIFGLGLRRIASEPAPARTIRVALIQPSIPQTLIWDSAEDENRFEKLLRLTETALVAKPDLLVWPEAAIPHFVRYHRDTHASIRELLAGTGTWMILGSDDAEPNEATPDPDDAHIFNSSFLMSPEGRLVSVYRKMRLVIFGEYVPLSRWLPFLKMLTPIEGGFTPGTAPVEFVIPDLQIRAAVLICFEDTFARHVRRHVTPGTDLLVNITNDGWFGESSAHWQHAVNALFRSIENGLPLVRCTNNGLTCWIDRVGRLHLASMGPANGTNVHQAGFDILEIPVHQTGPTETAPRPFFHRHGDVFGWACVLVTVAPFLKRRGRRSSRTVAQPKLPA